MTLYNSPLHSQQQSMARKFRALAWNVKLCAVSKTHFQKHIALSPHIYPAHIGLAFQHECDSSFIEGWPASFPSDREVGRGHWLNSRMAATRAPCAPLQPGLRCCIDWLALHCQCIAALIACAAASCRLVSQGVSGRCGGRTVARNRRRQI